MRYSWSSKTFVGVMAVTLGCLALTLGTVHLAADDESPPRDETTAERIERLKQLSPADRDELAKKKERFDKLSPDEKERLRRLHTNLVRHEHSDRLYGLATRYALWLRTLPAGQRAELMSLPPGQRLERIREIKQKQDEQRMRELVHTRLQPEDLQAVRKWLGEYADKHKGEIFEKMSKEMQQRMRADPDGMRRRFAMLLMPGRHGAPRLPLPTEVEIEQLRERLSGEARQALDSLDTADKKLGLVVHWARAAIWSRMMGPPASPEELEKFFSSEDLSDTRRDQLEKLPPEQFDQQLQWEYRMHKFRNRPGEFRPPWYRGPNGQPGRFRGDHSGGRPPGTRPGGRDRPGFGPPPRDGEQGGPPPRGGERDGPPPGGGEQIGPPRRDVEQGGPPRDRPQPPPEF